MVSERLGSLTFNPNTLLYEQQRTPAGFEWRCRCGAAGNSHSEHQQAYEFGVAHLKIEEVIIYLTDQAL